MANFIFVVESMKRHAKLIVIVTLAALLCGAGLSVVQATRSHHAGVYVAEVTFYVDGHEADEVNEYNYELNEDYLASDVRRIIVSSKVAGEVREEYGPEVTVTTPYWVNRETKNNVYSHYIYAEVTAPTPELALAAAQAVADKALVQIEEQLSVSKVILTEGPLLKSVAGMAADYGVDDLGEGALKQNALGVSPKTVFVAGFCGFALAMIVAIGRDLASRKVYTRNDVLRIFGVAALDSVPKAKLGSASSYYRLSAVLDSLARKEDASRLGVCGIGVEGAESLVAQYVGELALNVQVVCAVDVLADDAALVELAQADAVLLAVGQGVGGNAPMRASSLLNAAQLPCAGALFVEASK